MDKIVRTEILECRFSEKGCPSPAEVVVSCPKGCICWSDPVQALCAQHWITLESEGPVEVLADISYVESNSQD